MLRIFSIKMIDMTAPFSLELVNLGVYVTGFNILDDRMTKLGDDGNGS